MSAMNSDEITFVKIFSSRTGIDPRVVIAWIYQEGAFKKGGTGGFNYLNVMPKAGDKHIGTSSKGFAQFANATDAANAAVSVEQQGNMRVIQTMAASHPSPQEQINAIAASPWDAGHYGGTGGPKLTSVLSTLFSSAALQDKYQAPTQFNLNAVTSTFGTGSAADWTSIDMHSVGQAASAAASAVGNAAHNLVAPFESIGSAFAWLGNNWDRVLAVIGGAILVIIALIVLTKQQQTSLLKFAKAGEE